MDNFAFYAPTYFAFGKDAEAQTGALVKRFGGKKVLIHYGGGSVVRSGLLERVKKSLDEAGIGHVELGGAVPNPRLGLVYEGIDLCRKEGVDFVLGIGGVLTFKKSHLPEVLPAVVPMDRLVLETDAPYMAPVPKRGQRNEPAYTLYVLQRLAEAYSVSEEALAAQTEATVARIFGLK